jgi:hypothetical protein
VEAVNNMAFSAEKHVFLVELRVKTESFETMQSDYIRRFRCPAPARSVIQESVKQSRQTENVKVPKRVRRSIVVAETSRAEVSERKSAQVIAETCTTD